MFWTPKARCLLGAVLVVAAELAVAMPDLRWFEDARRPTEEARLAVEILHQADQEGLVPGDYEAEALRAAIGAAAAGEPLDAEAAERLDERLSVAMQRYLHDLHFGRLDPRSIHENFAILPEAFSPADYLADALAEHRLAEAVRQAAPRISLYGRLRDALGRYRALAGNSAWRAALPAFAGRKLEPGQPYAGIDVLAQRLRALGDLSPDATVRDRYAGMVVDGVKAFQARHGLEPDGVIGKSTLEQLNVTPAARARQIEISLERLRWTPLLQSSQMIVINIPEFVLRAYRIEAGEIRIETDMKVIVGKAMDTRTPIFEEDMRFIEFSPYWNVPPSIAKGETVPKLRRDPLYFGREGFEFVTGDGRVLTQLTPSNLGAVQRGELRIRQRPGPRNALGDIKFIFPNDDHIYLHHTPTPQLFQRDRRDFSHGCIRVEDPVALAKFVLRDDPEWTEERIRAAMAGGVSSTIRLRKPVRVLIAYSTVVVRGDGRIYFFPDLYGHDKLLDAALRQRLD